MKIPSPSMFLFIIINIYFSNLSPFVNSQTVTDSCSSILNINDLVPFDTTTLTCVPVWAPQNFILRYSQTSPNTWSFVLSAPDANAYIAMGFSPNGLMVGSSAMVGWMLRDGTTGGIKQYFLGGQTPSQVVPDQGNLNVINSSIISQSLRLYLTFQLNTTQPPDRVIYSVGQTAIRPVAPGFMLSKHSDKATTALNYVTGQTESQTPQLKLRRTHGILNMLGWGILIIIGAIIARYFKKWDPAWFYSHAIVQSLGFLLGLSGVICGFVLNNRLDANVSTHKALGIIILVLGCLQVMAILARPEKGSKLRKYWTWYHYSVGRVLMVFAIANVFYGLHLGERGNGWSAGYGIVIAILFLVVIILEIRLWKY